MNNKTPVHKLHVGDCFSWDGACENPPYGEITAEPRTYVKIPIVPGPCGTYYNCLILSSWRPVFVPDDTEVQILEEESGLVARISALSKQLDTMTQIALDAQGLRDLYFRKLKEIGAISA